VERWYTMADALNALKEEGAWLSFVAGSSQGGREWAAAYSIPCYGAIKEMADEALDLLRRYRLEDGSRKLAEIRQAVEALRGAPDSIFCVLEVWYHSALAYRHYLGEEFELAESNLTAAHDAARKAMELCDFLLPLAYVCSELAFQKIRIARNRRRWGEMAAQIDAVRGMLEGRHPLCTLGADRAVYISSLAEFCLRACTTTEEQALVGEMFRADLQLEGFDLFVHRIYVLPGFVIPYR
jgi:hypothetical protein